MRTPNQNLGHESWQAPDMAALYERSRLDPEFDVLAEIQATTAPPEEVNFRQNGRVDFMATSSEYDYGEKLPGDLYTIRPFGRPDRGPESRGRYIRGEFSDEAEAGEAISRACAARAFLRAFMSEPFADDAPDQNAWRIQQALRPERLKTVDDDIHDSMGRTVFWFDNELVGSGYSSGLRLPHLRNFSMLLAAHTESHPEEKDVLLANLRESAIDLADSEFNSADAQSLWVGLYYLDDKKPQKLYNFQPDTLEAFRSIAGDIRLAGTKKLQDVLSTISQHPFDPKLAELYDNAETMLAAEGHKPAKNLMIAATDMLQRLIEGVDSPLANDLARLTKQLAETAGVVTFRHYTQLANELLTRLPEPSGESPVRLDSSALGDFPKAIDRLTYLLIASAPETEPDRLEALATLGRCASRTAEIGAQRKLDQKSISLFDWMMRYPKATPEELQSMIKTLQRGGGNESVIRERYQDIRSSRRQHAPFRPGHGLTS